MGYRVRRLTHFFILLGAGIWLSACGHAEVRSESARPLPNTSASASTLAVNSQRTESAPQEPKFSQGHFTMPRAEVPLLMWPIANPRITQEFRSEIHGHPHDGIDIAAPKGTRIYAPADGKVVYAGQKFHGYGRMIVIEHTPKVATIFGHLQKLLVKSGEMVRKGSLIGLVGRTGRATAPHLHFEVRYNRIPVDPLGFMP